MSSGGRPTTGLTREKIFSEAAKKLRQDFEETVLVPHRGERGGEAEELVRDFLSARLPRRYAVGAGFVIDRRNQVSPQSDVIVFDAHNCPVYRTSEKAGIYPADNVAAVVEVKSALDKKELRDGFSKIAAIKKLVKHRAQGPLHSQTFGCVFAFGSKVSAETLVSHYCQNVADFGLGAHPDLVAVLDAGTITLMSWHPAMREWNNVLAYEGPGGPAGEGAHFGAGFAAAGGATLDLFFRLLLVSLNTFNAYQDFDWGGAAPAEVQITYLTSHTELKDPEERKRALRRYKAQAKSLMTVQAPAPETIQLGGPGPKRES